MKKFASVILALTLAVSLAACGGAAAASSAPAASVPAASASAPADAAATKPAEDRAGNAIALPDTINTIAVMAPSIAEEVIALGDADKLVAVDTVTAAQCADAIAADLPAFDMQSPDVEALAALAPDVVFVSGMSVIEGENLFQPLIDLGVTMVCVPTANTIADIYADITFLGAVLGHEDAAAQLNDTLKSGLDEIAATAATIPEGERKSVYFEISAAPYAYSFGNGVYMNEMIELAGGVNVLADQEGWLSVDTESIVAADPDVILTSVDYMDGAVEEIKSREGWSAVKAVANDEVYLIDSVTSGQPNQNILAAVQAMAADIYPDTFAAVQAAA